MTLTDRFKEFMSLHGFDTTHDNVKILSKMAIAFMKSAFDANTFGPDEVPVEYENGQSTDVLIDTTGERKYYSIGWYDHKYPGWHLDGDRDLVTSDTIRWSFLPLAIYDTNPELRKTVKL